MHRQGSDILEMTFLDIKDHVCVAGNICNSQGGAWPDVNAAPSHCQIAHESHDVIKLKQWFTFEAADT